MNEIINFIINEKLFDICLSLVTGVMFYLIFDILPRYRKEKLLKLNIAKSLLNSKNDILNILVESYRRDDNDSLLEKDLLNHKNFHIFFKDRWVKVIQNIINDEYLYQKLIIEFKVISNEINYFLNNVSIEEKKSLEYLIFYKNHFYKYSKINREYYHIYEDEVKPLGRDLWGLFTEWNMQNTYYKNNKFHESVFN